MKSGEKEGKFVTPSNTEQNESRERNETNQAYVDGNLVTGPAWPAHPNG